MPAFCRGLAIGAISLLLAACQDDGPIGSDAGGGAPDLLADERKKCERSGGRWGLRAGDALFLCYHETRDANKSCRVASDCEGLCLARSQSCSPIKPFLGCHEILTESGGRATQCVN